MTPCLDFYLRKTLTSKFRVLGYQSGWKSEKKGTREEIIGCRDEVFGIQSRRIGLLKRLGYTCTPYLYKRKQRQG